MIQIATIWYQIIGDDQEFQSQPLQHTPYREYKLFAAIN